MADGWKMLGDVLGGGIDREGAYQAGIQERDAGRIHRAKTEEALAQARIARDEATQRETLGDALTTMGIANPAELAIIMRGGFGNFQQATSGQLNRQRFDQRALVANPETDPDARRFARAALYSDPQNLTIADELDRARIDYEQSRAGAYDALTAQRQAKVDHPVQAVQEALPDLGTGDVFAPMPSAANPEFANEQELTAAINAGRIKTGDVVVINGQRFQIAPPE